MDLKKLKLPSVSPECSKILEMLGRENATTLRIAKVVALDPTLSGCLLRYANSSAYRRPTPVTSVSGAIGLLGLKNVTAAVLMTTMRSFSRNPTPLDDLLWQHAVTSSTLAKAVAEQCWAEHADKAELAGLLHDMGALMLSSNFPKEYTELVKQARATNEPLCALEATRFGITRQELMAHLAQELRLPEDIASWPALYHGPQTAENTSKPLAVLSLAHWVEVEHVQPKDRLPELIPYSRSVAQSCLGLDDNAVAEISSHCQQLLQERFAF